MDATEARYIIAKLLGNLSRDSYINAFREANNNPLAIASARKRYSSTLVNLSK